MAYFFDPVADIFEPIAAKLEAATGLKSYFLEQSRNHAATRWDWTPTAGSVAGPEMVGNDTTAGQRALGTVEFRAEIACRGKTHGDAWRMMQELLSASRSIKAASGRIESWLVEESSDQASTLKNVVKVTMVWPRPLLEQPLDAPTVPVTIQHVQFDTETEPYGTDDGTLIAPMG